MQRCRTVLAWFATVVLAGATTGLAPPPAAGDEAKAFLLAPLERHLGDLPAMQERHLIRALVTLNPSKFYLEQGRPRGFEYELLQQFERSLNKGLGRGQVPTRVIYVPMPFDALLSALAAGVGDIAAAGLTVTPERAARVAFTEPYLEQIDEVVVAGPGVVGLDRLDDLAGRTVHVLRASSYHQHLKALNREFQERQLAPIEVVEVDPHLATEDLLQLVEAGLLELTVADSHIAALWAPRLPGLTVRTDLAIHQGGQIAWAVRPDNPKLRARLDDFVRANRKGTLLGNILHERYYGSSIADPIAKDELDRLAGLRKLFEHYSGSYGFDWLATAAQAYQESGLDHSKRSPRGAIGIMQIRPETAADPHVGIADVTSLENNIHAGVKYSAFLRERYFSDADLRPEDRLGFTLAAYNAGPRRIGQVRNRAKAMGLDPNRWFQNVEYAALDLIGRETVRYVANIHKYYVAYRLTFETERRRLALLDVWRQPQE